MRDIFRGITPWSGTKSVYGDEFRQGLTYESSRPQGSGDFLLIYTVAGSGRIACPGSEWETHPGDVLLYEPHAFQDYRTNPRVARWHLVWAHFEIESRWTAWLDWPRLAPDIRGVHLPRGRAREEFVSALRETGGLSRRTGRFFPELARNALERALLQAMRFTQSELQRADPRIQKCLAFASANSHEALSIGRLAAHCGLSPSRFAHLFRSEVGTSPAAFLESERLRRAANLLRFTKLSIAEIAEKTGYQNAFYFSNRFKKNYGCPPRAFRQKAS